MPSLEKMPRSQFYWKCQKCGDCRKAVIVVLAEIAEIAESAEIFATGHFAGIAEFAATI